MWNRSTNTEFCLWHNVADIQKYNTDHNIAYEYKYLQWFGFTGHTQTSSDSLHNNFDKYTLTPHLILVSFDCYRFNFNEWSTDGLSRVFWVIFCVCIWKLTVYILQTGWVWWLQWASNSYICFSLLSHEDIQGKKDKRREKER